MRTTSDYDTADWRHHLFSTQVLFVSATKEKLAEVVDEVLASKPAVMTAEALLSLALGRLFLQTISETSTEEMMSLAVRKLSCKSGTGDSLVTYAPPLSISQFQLGRLKKVESLFNAALSSNASAFALMESNMD